MKMKKFGKMSSIFLIIHIKIRLQGKFYENLLKKSLTHVLGHFWLIKAKTKMKMKKYRKMSSIFEFSTSRLGYVAIFIKIGVKKFWPFFKTFLTIEGRMRMKMKKYGKMSLIFEFPYLDQDMWQFSLKSKKKSFDPFFKTF